MHEHSIEMGSTRRTLYDEMCRELSGAIRDLEQKGKRVKLSGLIWMQGESDAETDQMCSPIAALIQSIPWRPDRGP